MGSIRKSPRNPSRWEARYRDASGRQRTKTFPSRADAKAWMAATETDMRRGSWGRRQDRPGPPRSCEPANDAPDLRPSDRTYRPRGRNEDRVTPPTFAPETTSKRRRCIARLSILTSGAASEGTDPGPRGMVSAANYVRRSVPSLCWRSEERQPVLEHPTGPEVS